MPVHKGRSGRGKAAHNWRLDRQRLQELRSSPEAQNPERFGWPAGSPAVVAPRDEPVGKRRRPKKARKRSPTRAAA